MSMMKNMFSMFDPSSSFQCINWMIALPLLYYLKANKTQKTTKMMNLTNTLKNFIWKESEQSMQKKVKTSTNMMTMTFMCVFLMNMVSIFPFNFTMTAHISISFPMSTSIWMSTILYGWVNSFKTMMLHLTPMGTPSPLMNFMVLIELTSMMIRPITLSVRLSANMVAGHLLMTLLSSFSMNSFNQTILSTLAMITLILLEMGVALVQAYVFITLLLLYQNESV